MGPSGNGRKRILFWNGWSILPGVKRAWRSFSPSVITATHDTFSLGYHEMAPGVPIKGEEVAWNPDLSRLLLPPPEWPAHVRHGSFGGAAGGTEGLKELHPRYV